MKYSRFTLVALWIDCLRQGMGLSLYILYNVMHDIILTGIYEQLCFCSDWYLPTLLQVKPNKPDATNRWTLTVLLFHGGWGIIRLRVDVNGLECLIALQLTNQNSDLWFNQSWPLKKLLGVCGHRTNHNIMPKINVTFSWWICKTLALQLLWLTWIS